MRIRARLPVILLSLALVLAAVLAYKAQAAVRSQRASAERALVDYAAFATWQLAEYTRRDVLTVLVSSMVRQVSGVNPGAPPPARPSPAEFAAVTMGDDGRCRCLNGVRFFFRYDWRDSSFATAGQEPSAAVRRWARDTVIAHQRIFARPTGVENLAWGSTGRAPLHRLGVVLTNDSYVAVIGHVDGELRLIGYVVSRDVDGSPVATYGFETGAASFVASLLSDIVKRDPLLPPSLLRGLPTDSIAAVTVRDPAGESLYASSLRIPARYSASERLDERFGNMIVGVALRPDIADRLVVGGLPRSQLPLLLAVFALTAGLVVVAVVQLRRQQELARLRTDFVSGVSHELRTPLAQIRLFAELLHRDMLDDPAERRRSAHVIDQEARRLTYLVDNVLSFARSERGSARIQREPADIEREVRDALDAFAPLARARQAELRAELTPGMAAHVDRAALRQILLNLLDNAVKYGPAGQTVTVGAAPRDAVAQIWVADEGPGIPRGAEERIWAPFARLERDANSAVGGSGIGLAVVRELVELHGGRAHVEGADGGGARFVIDIPLDIPLDIVPSHDAEPAGAVARARPRGDASVNAGTRP